MQLTPCVCMQRARACNGETFCKPGPNEAGSRLLKLYGAGKKMAPEISGAIVKLSPLVAKGSRSRQRRQVRIAISPMNCSGRYSLCKPLQQCLCLRVIGKAYALVFQRNRERCVGQHF